MFVFNSPSSSSIDLNLLFTDFTFLLCRIERMIKLQHLLFLLSLMHDVVYKTQLYGLFVCISQVRWQSVIICRNGESVIHMWLIYYSYPLIFPGLLVRGLIPLFSPWDTLFFAHLQNVSIPSSPSLSLYHYICHCKKT